MNAPPWSVTRAKTFQECARKYYFRYQLAPRSRKPNPPAEALAASKVQDLVGLEAWAGNLVHGVIETVLSRWRAGKVVSEEQILDHARKLLSRQFRDSQAYWSASAEEFPRRPVLLDMHYYDTGAISKDRAAAIKETVLRSIRSFLDSELAVRIRNAGPQSWRPIDRNAAAHLDGQDVLILVKPDFAFQDGDLLHIVDWKTGKSDPYWERIQVTCYALYAHQRWQVPLNRIVPQIAHLFPEFRLSLAEYSEEAVPEVQLTIRESQQSILSLLDPDGLPPVQRFDFTPEPRRCGWCQFRGICDGAARCG
ncbi:MAG: PD-(D/E)XK nuclease family protein [Actinomycetota bacterium]